MTDWISVKDKLPEDTDIEMHEDPHLKFCSVLVYDEVKGVVIANRLITHPTNIGFVEKVKEKVGQVNDVWSWGDNVTGITHWMPLPEPPDKKINDDMEEK